MNIQINCKENVSENDLRYIYYNLKDYIRKYKETENNSSYYIYVNWKRCWQINALGNMLMKPKIKIRCNGRTMFFRIGGEDE